MCQLMVLGIFLVVLDPVFLDSLALYLQGWGPLACPFASM